MGKGKPGQPSVRPSVSECGSLTWLAVAPAAVGDSAPTGLRKRGGLSTGEFRRR